MTNPEPNNKTKEALKEYEEMLKNPDKYKRYESVEELMKDLGEK